MSINSDELFNLYSINKIIKNDGTINLADLETLTYLIDFISSHNSTQQATSAKLNDEDLLELININKNKNDTRTFLDKLEINDSSNDSSNCSNNIELIIDDSNAPEAFNEPEASNEPESSNEAEASNEPEAEASNSVNSVISKLKNKTKRKSHKKQKIIERKTKRNK
jgi:hypothetical protein